MLRSGKDGRSLTMCPSTRLSCDSDAVGVQATPITGVLEALRMPGLRRHDHVHNADGINVYTRRDPTVPLCVHTRVF